MQDRVDLFADLKEARAEAKDLDKETIKAFKGKVRDVDKICFKNSCALSAIPVAFALIDYTKAIERDDPKAPKLLKKAEDLEKVGIDILGKMDGRMVAPSSLIMAQPIGQPLCLW